MDNGYPGKPSQQSQMFCTGTLHIGKLSPRSANFSCGRNVDNENLPANASDTDNPGKIPEWKIAFQIP